MNWIPLSEYCGLAYRKGPSIEEHQKFVTHRLESKGWTDICFVSHAGTQVYLARRHKTVLVVFRGTENEFEDIRADICGWRSKDVFGRVHRGAQIALDAVWLKLKDEIDERLEPGDTITITGHSLGGLLATICAARLAHESYPVGTLVTYGSPPPGNFLFAHILSYVLRGRIFRVVHNADVVPRLLTMKALLYFHCGKLIWIGPRGLVATRSFIPRMLTILANLRRSISDHYMEHYINAARINGGTSL